MHETILTQRFNSIDDQEVPFAALALLTVEYFGTPQNDDTNVI